MTSLPIPSPKELKEKPWYIMNWSNPTAAKMTAKALDITCTPRNVGMDSGSGFKAKPLHKFPTDHVILEYSVFFPKDFEFVKGGKLPGIGLGPGDDAATGSDWQDDLGSVRVMWREKGQGIAYLYLPLEIAKNGTRDGTIKAQGPEFESAADGSLDKHAGIDVFFKQDDGLQFVKGQWNTVKIQVKINAPGKSDGFLGLTINGKTRDVKNVLYRKSKDIRINVALIIAFFGGSTMDWSAKKKEIISFKDFKLTCP